MSISQLLKRIKDQGCNILVTGAVPSTVSAYASRQLLGHPACHRERIVCLIGDRGQENWVAPRAPDRYTQTVVADSPSEFYQETLDRTVANEVQQAAKEITQSNGVESSDVRLCFYSLNPFVAEWGTQSTMEALAEVLNQVRSVSGMGYFHLPRPPNSSGVNKVKQEFDIEIELREHLEKDPAPEWRWHIPNYGTTNWLQITHWNNEYDT